MEIFFAKLIGIYFLITGAIVLVRGKAIMPAVRELAKNRALVLLMAVLDILAGIALVLAFPEIHWNPAGILSLIGYMMVVEGIIYLGGSTKFIQRFVSKFNTRGWYLSGGIASLALGLYLVSFAYGF